ncbi:XdhC family protein [Halofilum ochraceum]|uniref:XdhC family protein n=1 Tax=Halofilum ochraceum TaxID=1611323 RepID=UPI00082AC8FB|nr:XdhC family protein [Halofilum ochraceum]
MERAIREQLLADRAAGRPVVVATALDDGEQRLLHHDEGTAAFAEGAAATLRFDRAETREIDGRRWLFNPYNPPLRLYIIGAVHIAQSLAPLAAHTEFNVTVIDPRRTFATAERFPGVALDTAWPDEALATYTLDGRSAVVTLTHDPKLDDPALAAALNSEAFYIGALGSRRTHAGRRERLAEQGFGEDQIDRIHAPVGFSIGARGPAEIAISILAEAISVLRTGQ